MAKNATLAKTPKINFTKPLVEEFVDQQKAAIDFVTLAIPHVPHSFAKIVKVFCSKDGKTSRFRINWYGENTTPNSLISVRNITKSQYIQVNENDDGKFSLSEK